MDFDPLGSLFDLGKTAIEKIWPDPVRRAEEMRKLEEMRQRGDLAELDAHVKLMLAQLEINKIEAQHKSIFVAGWRPAAGWVGVITLALTYIPKTIALTGMWIWQAYSMLNGAADPSTITLPPFPDLGVTDVIGLLGSLLGIGVMRSVDKAKGTQTDSIR